MASILPARGTCEKNERGFCSSSRYEKKPLSVFKIHFHFPRNGLGRRHAEQAKMAKKREKAVFFREGGIPDPP
jgi:hypothetical protein